MSTSPAYSHCSVMLEEVLTHLQPQPGGIYCDATLGGGGHAEQLLLRSAPSGRVIGIDRDPDALRATGERLQPFGDRFTPVHGRFSELPALLRSCGIPAVDGILADVGCSSAQLDQPERGFSFQRPGPIDMRMDPGHGDSALDLIGRLDEDALAQVLLIYGEERYSRRVARALKAAMNKGHLTDTLVLANVVAGAVPTSEARLNPATRTFQALRIAVNDELRELDRLVRIAPECLRPGGRLAVICFHSLEDRVVKLRMRELRSDTGGRALSVVTNKPVYPTKAEVARNQRARSARLRVAERPRQTQPLKSENSAEPAEARS